jgi:hypothetical protein
LVFRLCALSCRSSLAATVANVSGRYSMTLLCTMAAGERFRYEGGGDYYGERKHSCIWCIPLWRCCINSS